MHTNTHPQTVLVWYVETEEQKIHCQAETCCAMPHNFAVQRRDVVFSPQNVYLQTHTHTRTEDAQTLSPILTTGNTLRTQSFHSHSATLSARRTTHNVVLFAPCGLVETGYFYHPSSISCVPTVAQIGTRFKTRPSVRGEHHFSLATCNRGLPQCIAMATRSVKECTGVVWKNNRREEVDIGEKRIIKKSQGWGGKPFSTTCRLTATVECGDLT